MNAGVIGFAETSNVRVNVDATASELFEFQGMSIEKRMGDRCRISVGTHRRLSKEYGSRSTREFEESVALVYFEVNRIIRATNYNEYRDCHRRELVLYALALRHACPSS